MNRENLIYNLWYRQPDWYSWSKAFLLSLFLHLGILLLALTFSSVSPRVTFQPIVYNVELVSVTENPVRSKAANIKAKNTSPAKSRGTKKSLTTRTGTIPIWRVKTQPASNIDTTVKKASVAPPSVKPAETPPEVRKELEKLTRFTGEEKKTKPSKGVSSGKAESVAHVTPSASSGTSEASAAATAPTGEALSLARSAYYAEVWDRIRKEWALPDELVARKGNLGATIVIKIRRDGKIIEARFEKRSGDKVFDESVWRAVWKADPLPPFPQIYSAKTDELGIRFRLSELLK